VILYETGGRFRGDGYIRVHVGGDGGGKIKGHVFGGSANLQGSRNQRKDDACLKKIWVDLKKEGGLEGARARVNNQTLQTLSALRKNRRRKGEAKLSFSTRDYLYKGEGKPESFFPFFDGL